jgi:hypothetical protein
LASISPKHKKGCARLGFARLNAFRLNVYEPVWTVLVNGAVPIGGATYTEQVVADGASNQWRLGEKAGGLAYDTLGGKHGTLSGGVMRGAAGALNDGDTAMSFNGTTAKIVTALAVTVPVVATLEAWVLGTDSGYRTILSTRPVGDAGGTVWFGTFQKKLLLVSTTLSVPSNRVVLDGLWHHCVAVVNGTTYSLYVDGVLDATGPFARTSASTVPPVGIGWDAFGNLFWVGLLDEVAIYPVELTPAKIAAHYAARLTGPAVEHTGLMIEGAGIEQILNEQTDTAAFVARGWVPVTGQQLDLYVGDRTPGQQVFGGRILETTTRYLLRPIAKNVVYDVHSVDPTWLLKRTKVLASYVNQSATVIVLDLIARFARGVTTTAVQQGLPTIPALTFTNEDLPTCLTTICQQVGAYWFLDYASVLHLFTVADRPASAITQANPGTSANHALTEDLSQVVTRIIGRGGGVGAAVDTPKGFTELPLEQGDALPVSWYQSSGGLVEVNSQRLTYTGIKGDKGAGATLGTGNAPTVKPGLAPASGSGLASGTYQYAISYKTASGETLVGPVASFVTGGSAPTLFQTTMREDYYNRPPGMMTTGGSYSWRVAIAYEGGGYSLGPPTATYVVSAKYYQIYVGFRATDPVTGFDYNTAFMSNGPAKIIQTLIYRTTNGGATWYLSTLNNGPYVPAADGWYKLYDDIIDADLPVMGAYPPGATATFNAVKVTVPVSPHPSVTGRAVYRSTVNGSALKKLTDLANNTTTSYTDTTADASLGAAPPVADTSQLREEGQVLAGSPTMLVTNPQPFLDDGGASGGWVRLGNMTVRYTGISGNSLTGIPPTGPGSITATARYGAQVLVQPRLIGIPASGTGAILLPIRMGDLVIVRLEIQDDNAAAALASKMGSADYKDGLVEHVISDSRFTPSELLAQMQATLAERKDPQRTVTYETRDTTHEIGRLVTINLTAPPIVGTFRIQRVRLTEIAFAGAANYVLPKRLVEATNRLYTFADLLRRLRGREGGVP